MGCLQKGVLALTPDLTRVDNSKQITEHSYLVTREEIVHTGTMAKLVVLSAGWSWFERGNVDEGFALPTAFLDAGALGINVDCFFKNSKSRYIFRQLNIYSNKFDEGF